MPADSRVTRSSFSGRLQPISVAHPISVLPGRIWSDDDWARIQRGFAARDMDDRWHILTEDNIVFLHRSWTGFGVFEATFAPVDGGCASPKPWSNATRAVTGVRMTTMTVGCSNW